jgi:hypothetical protein
MALLIAKPSILASIGSGIYGVSEMEYEKWAVEGGVAGTGWSEREGCKKGEGWAQVSDREWIMEYIGGAALSRPSISAIGYPARVIRKRIQMLTRFFPSNSW